ncbi:nitroreductase family protein [Candidatus Omnitrophota bacterium]
MDVMKAIQTRRSVRSYEDTPVTKEKLQSILEAARLAPSAGNRQEWRFIVVRDHATRQKLMAAAKDQAFVGQAPAVIACCAETDGHTMTCGQLCYPIDVAIAIDHVTLAATAEGLGTCWVGAFHEDRVKDILQIPREIRVVELVTVGYANDAGGGDKQRLPFEDIIMHESWQKSSSEGTA